MSDMFDSDEFWSDDRDDSNAALDHLMDERREDTLMALYQAASRGTEERYLRVLCAEVGLSYDTDLANYVPPILRRKQEPDEATLSLPF